MDAHILKSILVPIDFSELSTYALRTALMVSQWCGDPRITAMYANWFEVPPYFTFDRRAELQLEFRESLNLAKQTLESFVFPMGGERANSIDTQVVDALPADGIRLLAAQTGADLIVMGTHGRSGWNRWKLGSVTEVVLHESRVPVLTVRSAPHETIRQVLCPVDDTELGRQALRSAAGIGACFGATVTVLHVAEPRGAGIADLCRWVPTEERARCNIREMHLEGGSPAEEIVKVATEGSYDLVVLGAARRRFFDGMILGTTTLRTVRHSPCPVLTVNPAASR